MHRAFPIAFLCSLLISFPARAAHVLPVGEVILSHGEGFHVITSKTEVDAGDTVVAGPGGKAKIVYANGCVIEVSPGKVVTVEDQEPSVVANQCTRSANIRGSFAVDPDLVVLPQVGVIIAKDAAHRPPWPAGP